MATDSAVPDMVSESQVMVARVYLVGDDASSRELIVQALAGMGFAIVAFANAAELLEHLRKRPSRPCCVICDVDMPDMDGLRLQRELRSDRNNVPVIFVTATTELPIVVNAMKAGASDFISKPPKADRLRAAVLEAVQKDITRSERNRDREMRAHRLHQLTPREREVLILLGKGFDTKEVAKELNISAKTVFVHRARVEEKFGVTNLVHLSHAYQALVNDGLVG